MRESVIDVLFYLFDDILPYQETPQTDLEEIIQWLGEAGFEQKEIMRAIDWFYELSEIEQYSPPKGGECDRSVRIFSAQEKYYIDDEGQNYLRKLVRTGLIDNRLLDCIIERVIALEEPVDVSALRWITTIVVLNTCEDRYERLAAWQEQYLREDSSVMQ